MPRMTGEALEGIPLGRNMVPLTGGFSLLPSIKTPQSFNYLYSDGLPLMFRMTGEALADPHSAGKYSVD